MGSAAGAQEAGLRVSVSRHRRAGGLWKGSRDTWAGRKGLSFGGTGDGGDGEDSDTDGGLRLGRLGRLGAGDRRPRQADQRPGAGARAAADSHREYTVLRGPHIDKKSREQFEMRTHKRLIDIYEPTARTIEALNRLIVPAGVFIKIKT